MESVRFLQITVESFIREYHVYKDETIWVPEIDEKKDLKRELQNLKDVNAVAVVRPSCAHADIPDPNKKPEPHHRLSMLRYCKRTG